jgi:hypothetical protein
MYVYGIVPASRRAPSGTGVAKGRLRSLQAGELGAIVSAVRDGELQAGREDLLAHARVLERAVSDGAVLPMRFGMVMADADAVREELLERYQDDLLAQLEELAGTVEIDLRAVYDEQVVMREIVAGDQRIAERTEALRERDPDSAYYERVALGQMVAEALEQVREADTSSLLETLEPLAVAAQVAEPEHERVAAHVSFLVDAAQLAEFDRAVDELGRAHAGRMQLRYTGPLAPYSFVHLPAGV